MASELVIVLGQDWDWREIMRQILTRQPNGYHAAEVESVEATIQFLSQHADVRLIIADGDDDAAYCELLDFIKGECLNISVVAAVSGVDDTAKEWGRKQGFAAVIDKSASPADVRDTIWDIIEKQEEG